MENIETNTSIQKMKEASQERERIILTISMSPYAVKKVEDTSKRFGVGKSKTIETLCLAAITDIENGLKKKK
jgi:hypothetical protein